MEASACLFSSLKPNVTMGRKRTEKKATSLIKEKNNPNSKPHSSRRAATLKRGAQEKEFVSDGLDGTGKGN